MSKRSSWITILVLVAIAAFLIFGGGSAIWHAFLRMHGMH